MVLQRVLCIIIIIAIFII